MLGSITASGQQDLSRLESTWGESSPRPVEYGALVLAHDALSGGFWCEVRLFGLDFGARCVVRRFWGRFRCTVCLFGVVFGVWRAPFWVRFWRVAFLYFGAWCDVRVDHSQRATESIQIGEDLTEGNRARDLSNMWPWSWRMMPFRVDFGARCAFSARFWCAVRRFWGGFWCAVRRFWRGIEPETCRIWGLGHGAWCPFGWILVRGAPFRARFWCAVRRFLRWILVRGAPFLGWILVRGMWCADFGADFGARCVVFGLASVRGAPFLSSILVRGAWCADFGADFGARCAFLGSFLVCGAPFLGSILVHGVWCADFGADFVARCAFLGSILARCIFGIDFGIDFGAWCADVGVDHSQRATRSIKTWTFCFLALCWAPLSWPQNVVTTLFKTIASFLHA